MLPTHQKKTSTPCRGQLPLLPPTWEQLPPVPHHEFCAPESSTTDVIVRGEKLSVARAVPCHETGNSRKGVRMVIHHEGSSWFALGGTCHQKHPTVAKSLRMSTPKAHQDWSDLLFRSSEGAIARTVGHPVHLSRAPQLPNALPNHVWNLSANHGNNK